MTTLTKKACDTDISNIRGKHSVAEFKEIKSHFFGLVEQHGWDAVIEVFLKKRITTEDYFATINYDNYISSQVIWCLEHIWLPEKDRTHDELLEQLHAFIQSDLEKDEDYIVMKKEREAAEAKSRAKRTGLNGDYNKEW